MINEIISSLNKEEKRFFKIYSNRTLNNNNNNNNRKDIILFDYLNTKKNIDDNELLKKLNLSNKNSLYQLKNRLFLLIINVFFGSSVCILEIKKHQESLFFSFDYNLYGLLFNDSYSLI